MLDQVVTHFKVDHVELVPTFQNPFKGDTYFSENNRLNALKAYLPYLPQHQILTTYAISEIELKQKKVCYTIDTINAFRELYPNDRLMLLIGSDNFFGLHQWKFFRKILEQVTLCVIRRDHLKLDSYKNYIYDHLHQKEFTSIMVIGNTVCQISSTEIREKISRKDSVKDVIPKLVCDALNISESDRS